MKSTDPTTPDCRTGFLSRYGGMIAILLVGAGVFVWKAAIAAQIQFIGFGDPAAYGEIAWSILSGRGLEVDYISMHFMKFGPDISHPEETWPPLYSILIVPFFMYFGKTALAAKLPSILISCFCLPPATYAVARQVSRSHVVAFASALVVLLFAPMQCWSLQAMADVTLACLVTIALFCALKGWYAPKWYLWMGIALGLAYYAKASAFLCLLAVALHYLIRRIMITRREKNSRRDLLFIAGMAVFTIVVAPWLIRNAQHFNDPFFYVNKHVSGYIGWEPWEESTYSVYWDRTLPAASDKLSQPDRLLETGIQNLGRYFRILFLDTDPNLFLNDGQEVRPISWSRISTWWTGIPAALGAGLFLLLGMAHIATCIRSKSFEETSRNAITSLLHTEARCGFGLFILVMLFLVIPLALFWVPHARLTAPLIPLVVIMGWTTVHSIADRTLSKIRFKGPIAIAVLVAAMAVWTAHEIQCLAEEKRAGPFPWNDKAQTLVTMGDWLRNNAPSAVILTRHPWSLHFHSDNKTVRLPVGPLEDVIRVGRHYEATHVIIPPGFERTFNPWVQGEVPGLAEVPGIRGLYEIDYSRISER